MFFFSPSSLLFLSQGELWPLSLADARSHGLSQENIEKIQQHSTRRVLVIKGITQVLWMFSLFIVIAIIFFFSRLFQGASAGKYLKVGDILISIDNEIVTTFLDVERLSQKEKLSITLLRDGKEMMIPDVPTDGYVFVYFIVLLSPSSFHLTFPPQKKIKKYKTASTVSVVHPSSSGLEPSSKNPTEKF